MHFQKCNIVTRCGTLKSNTIAPLVPPKSWPRWVPAAWNQQSDISTEHYRPSARNNERYWQRMRLALVAIDLKRVYRNVCYWHIADLLVARTDVCFAR